MIAPLPFKCVCEICGFSRIVKSKSDVLGLEDFKSRICPNCDILMKIHETWSVKDISLFERLLKFFKY